MPEAVRKGIGFALWRAQEGKRHPHTKVLKGFGHAGVLEILEDDDGNTYRAVYTVRFAEAVYVLHVFQKKSPRGAEVPRATMALIAQRLRAAAAVHRARMRETR